MNRLVNGHNLIGIVVFSQLSDICELGHAFHSTAALLAALGAGMVDQNTPHCFCCCSKESTAIGAQNGRVILQLEICLVNQGGRLERMAWSLVCDPRPRNGAQLLVNLGEQ
jgi:hypothetical protein